MGAAKIATEDFTTEKLTAEATTKPREDTRETAISGGTIATVVSLRAEVPQGLHGVMAAFIETHPHWDQYRLFQAALAGFLVQNGSRNRAVTRCYLANLLPSSLDFSIRRPERTPHGFNPNPSGHAKPPGPIRSNAPAVPATGWR
jgi:hypothetical protein